MPDRHCPKGAAAADGTRQQQLNMRRNGLKYNAGPPTPPTRCHWYWHARKAHGVVFIKASGNDMAGNVVDSPMQAWGRQCMTRWAPSAGLPQRRMHCAVRRLRASHRPVRLRGRWAHTRYYKRLLTHIKKRGVQCCSRALSPVHVALGALRGVTTTSRALGRSLLQRPLACQAVGQRRVDRCVCTGRGLGAALRAAKA